MDAAFCNTAVRDDVEDKHLPSDRPVYFHLVLERVDALREMDEEDTQHSLLARLLQLSKVNHRFTQSLDVH
jgi:hypothetical protein